MHVADLVGIIGITGVLLVYTCQQGVCPRGHVLPLRLPVSVSTAVQLPPNTFLDYYKWKNEKVKKWKSEKNEKVKKLRSEKTESSITERLPHHCTLKKKQSRYTPWMRLGERRYSSYSFTTSALDGGEWSASRPGRAFTPGERTPVPIVQEAGWAPESVGTQRLEEKSFAPAGDRTPISQSSSP
jgi:hypothetical protein